MTDNQTRNQQDQKRDNEGQYSSGSSGNRDVNKQPTQQDKDKSGKQGNFGSGTGSKSTQDKGDW